MRSLILLGLFLIGISASASPASADVRVFVRHEVNDYAVWRKAYNDFDQTRRKLGVTSQSVYQLGENPNDVTVIHDFKTSETAKNFIKSPELKAAMEKAGVKGAPQVWLTSRAAK
jgi:hypothetical protein